MVPTLYRRAPQVRHPSSAPCVRPLMWSHSICSADGYAEGLRLSPLTMYDRIRRAYWPTCAVGGQTTSDHRLPLRRVACISIRPLQKSRRFARSARKNQGPLLSFPRPPPSPPASSPRPTQRPRSLRCLCPASTVRHSAAGGWRTRLAVRSTSAEYGASDEAQPNEGTKRMQTSSAPAHVHLRPLRLAPGLHPDSRPSPLRPP
jgi:hypothetical protein